MCCFCDIVFSHLPVKNLSQNKVLTKSHILLHYSLRFGKVYILRNMEPAIELARLDTGGGEIRDIKNAIDKNKSEISKIRKIITSILIPMLGIIILCGGLIVGVLSGYIIKLPHSQTDESGLVNVSKPGKL